VPDVALPSVGDAFYFGGAWGGVNGTSWSAPQAAAMTAGMYEYCGGPFVTSLGASPVARWYTAYQRSVSNFVDVIGGNNQYNSTSPFYSAGAGYDNTTGLGLPKGSQIMISLCPNRTPASRVMRSFGLVARDSYGQASDTSMHYVPSMAHVVDLGERGYAPVEVTLVMRATPTIASDEQTVISSLTAAGFAITQTYPNHLVIQATAPAQTVGHYFQTSIHNLNQGALGMRYANMTPVIVPASIARVVNGAIVDDMTAARPLFGGLKP
jgi:hypothetical protein